MTLFFEFDLDSIKKNVKKVKFSHTRFRALGPELTPVYRQFKSAGPQIPPQPIDRYQIIVLGDRGTCL